MKKTTEEDGWRSFLDLCLKAKSQKELGDLLDFFLTPTERSEVSTRCLIVRELLLGKKTQREMAKDLKVSIAKITRGSNILKTISADLRKLLEK